MIDLAQVARLDGRADEHTAGNIVRALIGDADRAGDPSTGRPHDADAAGHEGGDPLFDLRPVVRDRAAIQAAIHAAAAKEIAKERTGPTAVSSPSPPAPLPVARVLN
ncbi:MAG: hypothetical protein KIT31_16610 [Deltaproteobacteria bacterium]|nr:hypothetical protein [Deltaproteobacteria bacterium]